MSLIRLVDVTFAYPQQSELITACTLELRAGWTGIIGRNGEGKSTLLELVDGALEPHVGRVDRGDLSVVRCRQSVGMAADVLDFATAWTNVSMRWMSLLGLDAEDYWRWDELSPGTRRRWQIGAALAAEPGALLLDEPTNHLDSAGRELLMTALGNYRGVGVVVSHDRDLLDRLCMWTARIRGGAVRLYPGGYGAARELWRGEALQARCQLEAAQDQARALQAQLNARTHNHTAAVRGLSTRSRMTSIRDTDARSTAAKARAQNGEAVLARKKAVTRAALDRAENDAAQLARPDRASQPIFVDAPRCPRSYVLRFEGRVEIGGRILVERARLHLRNDERVWMRGPNGCGKTTLLRAALAGCDLPDDRLLHVPQRLDAPEVMAAFAELDAESRRRALHVGTALCLDVEAVLDETSLSPGEARKLAIAVGLVKAPWMIVLDEPTNDLDLDAVERLEEALDDYPGAILLVTHDPRFARRIHASPCEFTQLET